MEEQLYRLVKSHLDPLRPTKCSRVFLKAYGVVLGRKSILGKEIYKFGVTNTVTTTIRGFVLCFPQPPHFKNRALVALSEGSECNFTAACTSSEVAIAALPLVQSAVNLRS